MRRAAVALALVAVVAAVMPLGAAAQEVDLQQPRELNVRGDHISWVDASTGETAYFVDATIGSFERHFVLPPDSTRVDLPLDFRPSCDGPLGSTLEVRVVAVGPTGQSDPAVGSLAGVCGPTTGTSTPLPPTPGPPPTATATPLLPEDGGPPGGVIGGFIYLDVDASGDLSPADEPAPREGIVVRQTGPVSTSYFEENTGTGEDGRWEIRAVPDGPYEVIWGPQLRDPANYARTIPPAQEIQRGPDPVYGTSTVVVLTVEIVGANRVLDLEMGKPLEPPVYGPPAQLPDTGVGDGDDSLTAVTALVAAGLVSSLAAALWLARRRTAA